MCGYETTLVAVTVSYIPYISVSVSVSVSVTVAD